MIANTTKVAYVQVSESNQVLGECASSPLETKKKPATGKSDWDECPGVVFHSLSKERASSSSDVSSQED